MKNILLFLIIASCISSFAQKTSSDTISETFVKSNWAYRLDLGANFMQTHDGNLYFDYAQTIAHSLFYKDFFTSLKIQKEFIIIDNEDPFYYRHIFDLFALGLGYNYDFSPKWGSDLYLAYNYSSFIMEKSYMKEYWNLKEYGSYDGMQLSLGLNRYFKLKRNNYIVLSAKANFVCNIKFTPYGGDYIKNEELINNNNYTNFGLSVAYKGWFRKRI